MTLPNRSQFLQQTGAPAPVCVRFGLGAGLLGRMGLRLIALGAVAVGVGAGAGCSSLRIGGSVQPYTELDSLRRENKAKTKRVEELERNVKELESKLDSKLASSQSGLSPEVLRAMPMVSQLEIDSTSGVTVARDTKSSVADVYLKPTDGRGRAVQAVGTITVELRAAGALPKDATEAQIEAAGTVIASAVLSPEQVRDAYRSGFVGTGYTVSLPIEQSKLIRPGTLIVRASLADALSGRTFSVTRTVDVRGAAGK